MKIKTLYIVAAAIMLASLSGCGIFHKDCGCPHFGMIKTPPTAMRTTGVA